MGTEKKYVSQSYYADGNRERTDVPFFVNCVGEVVIKRQFVTTVPQGRNDCYVMYMQGGCLSVKVAGEACLLMPGQMLCIPPHTSYEYHNGLNDEPVRYYWLHFTGSELAATLEACGIRSGAVCYVGVDRQIGEQIEELFGEFRSRRSNFSYAAAIKVQHILLLLARCAARTDTDEEDKLDRSIRYIHTHICEELSVAALAEMEFFSPSHYRALFRRATGLSPMAYITRQRIHLACDLLGQGSPGLSRVAELCGYRDRLYFQRVFKKEMGISPGEYRRKYHG